MFLKYHLNWPAYPDDPQGIRVASVIEFSVCLSMDLCVGVFWANFLILPAGRRAGPRGNFY